MAVSLGGLSPELTNIIQQNMLQRMFQDALFPALQFRAEAEPERWEANEGETKIMTRNGLIAVNKVPLAPGADPTPKQYAIEQWSVTANQYGDAIDTHMPSARAAIPGKLLKDTQALGLNAGETLNALVRDRLFQAYLQGNTAVTVIAAIGAVNIHVASLNGFSTTQLNGRPTAVSAANPLVVTFSNAEPANTVIATTPDNPAAPLGPGWLTLGAVLTVGLPARTAVLAATRAVVYRVGGGASVDAIGAADILQLQDVINAGQILKGNKVPRMMDGKFHHHLNESAVAQIFSDNQWQRLHESLPENADYANVSIGSAVGCYHYENTECPNDQNSGTLVATGAGGAFCAPDIGGEVINNAGIRIGRTIIIGRTAIRECYIPEMEYLTEAGAQGKVKSFTVTNNGVAIDTARIRYTLRAPQDRLQQVIGHAWSFSGDWAIPTDQQTGGAAIVKRAIVIEHALG